MPTIYETVVQAAEDYLRRCSSFDQENSRSNTQIIKDINDRINSGDIILSTTDGTIKSYLSYAASDPDTFLVSGGPRSGYWLSKLAMPKPIAATEIEIAVDSISEPFYEKDLYPLVEAWLGVKGYTSKDTSTIKSGGKWGNPDIVGVSITQLFGATDVDTVSCEVKLHIDSWEQYIFEAVSHKRFCNRSWFCYRVESEGQALPKWMQDYSERYRVGIVQIVLSDKELSAIKKDVSKAGEFVDRVAEKIPALYDHVPLSEKARLISRAGISLTLGFNASG